MAKRAVPAELAAHARERDQLLTRIAIELENDARILAAWLTGSLAIGTADEWSDLDLYVAVTEEGFETFVAQRYELHRRVGDVILTQTIDADHNSENLGSHFDLLVYRGGIEVDWTIMPYRLAHRPEWSRLLFDRGEGAVDTPPAQTEAERRDLLQGRLHFFWALTAVALKEVGRGYTTGAASTIRLMTDSFHLLWRLLYGPVDEYPASRAARHRTRIPDLEEQLPRLGREIDPLLAIDVIRRLCAGMETMHPALRAKGVSIPEEMPDEMVKLGALAAATSRHGIVT